jgi:Zn-finger nucleic acid-binding protein
MQPDQASGGLVCRHCGSVEPVATLIEGIEVGEASVLACPDCATPLTEARLDGRPFLLCQQCLGMLVGMSHFVAVVDAARARTDRGTSVPPRRQNPGDRHVSCPACRGGMLSHLYGGPGNLVIDTCERCQLNWLDPGELRRIARAP